MKNFNNFFLHLFYISPTTARDDVARSREQTIRPPSATPSFTMIFNYSPFVCKIMNIPAENHHSVKESTKNLFTNSLKSMSNAFSIAKLLLVCWGLENQRNFPHRLFVSLPSGCKKKHQKWKECSNWVGAWNRRGNVQFCLVRSSSSCLSIINILIHFPKRRRKESLFQRLAQVTWRRFWLWVKH